MDLECHHLALTKAEQAYNNLVGVIQKGVTAAHLLLDDKCNEASIYRGLLLGCPWGTGATFDELYLAQLRTDVAMAESVFNLRYVQIDVRTTVSSRMTHAQISRELRVCLDVILKAYPEKERIKLSTRIQ